ncbi:putative GMP synthase [Daphnia magna]|uniref:Putative GMP synthase n=1 Tax=Daphnia magna TaxID=35525 RepID=A0A164M2G6_9CRUS|nr:putative GMP synthase [Daphnia magna]
MEADFGKTQVLIRLMVDYANMATKENAWLNRIEIAMSEEERLLLEELSSHNQLSGTSRTPGTVELLTRWRSSTPERTSDLSSGKPSMELLQAYINFQRHLGDKSLADYQGHGTDS